MGMEMVLDDKKAALVMGGFITKRCQLSVDCFITYYI
jgi:hypothetical protein